MIAWILAAASTLVSVTALAWGGDGHRIMEIKGPVTAVYDGDTFSIGSTKIRVFGIDAPELYQQCKTDDGVCEPCGEQSREALAELILGKEVSCLARGKSYERVVAECAVDGLPIGPTMLEQGHAVTYTQFLRNGDSAYSIAQSHAREARTGLWNVQFIPPADWRRNGARLECER